AGARSGLPTAPGAARRQGSGTTSRSVPLAGLHQRGAPPGANALPRPKHLRPHLRAPGKGELVEPSNAALELDLITPVLLLFLFLVVVLGLGAAVQDVDAVAAQAARAASI